MQTVSTLHPKAANGPWLTVPITKARRPKSADSSTRPLRSSPLTGPALNLSLVAFTAPSLTASNSEPTDHTHPKSSTQPFSDPSSSSPTTFRRSNYGSVTAGGFRTSGRSQSLTMDTGHATRTATTMPEWEIDSLQNPIPPRNSKSRLRPQSSSGISSFRRPIPIVEEEADQVEVDAVEPLSKDISNTSRNSSTHEFTEKQSTSHTRDNSWYTANPYDVTPRFSRLGLSASGVVMPLSVKEHRRLSSATNSSNSASPILRRFSITSPSSPKSPPKSPPILPPILPPTTPTRIALRPRSPPLQLLHSYMSSHPQPVSRPISTMSSSETSSIASISQRDTPTPISISVSNFTSSPSLTRSWGSGDSLSTWYESCLPTPPEHDEVLSTVHDEECEGDKGEMDGGDEEIEEIAGVGEFRGLHGHRDRDHGHDQIKYFDITVGNDSDNDKTRPEKELVSKSTTIEQSPKMFIHSDLQLHFPPSNSSSTQATLSNPPLQASTLPNDIEKGRDSQQKTLVRIKLQSVDFEAVRSFPAADMNTMKTMPTTTTTPVTPEVGVELGVGSAVVPPVMVGSENTLVNVPPLLPIPTLKKKRSTFKSALKNFIKRW